MIGSNETLLNKTEQSKCFFTLNNHSQLHKQRMFYMLQLTTCIFPEILVKSTSIYHSVGKQKTYKNHIHITLKIKSKTCSRISLCTFTTTLLLIESKISDSEVKCHMAFQFQWKYKCIHDYSRLKISTIFLQDRTACSYQFKNQIDFFLTTVDRRHKALLFV